MSQPRGVEQERLRSAILACMRGPWTPCGTPACVRGPRMTASAPARNDPCLISFSEKRNKHRHQKPSTGFATYVPGSRWSDRPGSMPLPLNAPPGAETFRREKVSLPGCSSQAVCNCEKWKQLRCADIKRWLNVVHHAHTIA